jgi:hypothetical protein
MDIFSAKDFESLYDQYGLEKPPKKDFGSAIFIYP